MPLRYAAVVGAIPFAINHGDALQRGDIGNARPFKMVQTVLVSYAVSTLSSVGAMKAAARQISRS